MHVKHNIPGKRQFRSKWRLRSIFLIVNLSILILPLAGVFFFRIYENELLRQTEQELIVHSAFISSLYRNELRKMVPDMQSFGMPLKNYVPTLVDGKYTPIYPQIDLEKHVTLPMRPDAKRSENPADALAMKAAIAIYPLLQDVQNTTLAGMRLLDFNGAVIAGREDIGFSFAHLPEVQAAMRGKYYAVIRERDQRNPALASISRGSGVRVFIAAPIIEHNRLWGIAYLSRTPQNIVKHLYAEQRKVILAGATILGLALFLTLFTAYMVTRPIYRLIRQAEQVSAGDASAIRPLRRPAIKEVELLSNSFLRMAHALHSRSEYIRDFATHVSHEFKTPLTAICGATELLIEHADTMELHELQKFLRNIAMDTDRLTRLVKRLLELARADNVEPTDETTEIAALCASLRERCKDTLILECDLPSAPVSISHDNLETILGNLLDNAHQHQASHVYLTGEKADNWLMLTVADNGKGISPANRSKLFTPFFTTRRETGGTGLGLGIVASLIGAHGGRIALIESIKGASFLLHLPLQKTPA